MRNSNLIKPKEVYKMVGYRKYSEAWYNHEDKRIEEKKEKLKRNDLEMFELTKLYSEELTLLKDLNDYEFTKIEQKYEPMENRV